MKLALKLIISYFKINSSFITHGQGFGLTLGVVVAPYFGPQDLTATKKRKKAKI